MALDTSNKVRLGTLYEKKSGRGGSYFVGRMGDANVSLLRDFSAKGNDPVWALYVESREGQGIFAKQPVNPTLAKPVARKAPPPKPDPAPEKTEPRLYGADLHHYAYKETGIWLPWWGPHPDPKPAPPSGLAEPGPRPIQEILGMGAQVIDPPPDRHQGAEAPSRLS